MLEEKWWNPKTFEQLEKEEKDRQFIQWVRDKCKNVISYYSGGKSDYDKNYEKDGYMVIKTYTKSAYDSCRFSETYQVPIDEFWDCDNVMDMKVERTL